MSAYSYTLNTINKVLYHIKYRLYVDITIMIDDCSRSRRRRFRLGLKPNLILEGNAYDKFYNSLKTKATRKLYPVALRKFMAFQKVENVNDLLPSLPEKTALINAKVIDWIVFMRDIEQIAPRSVTTYLAGVLKFYKKNHVILDEDDTSDYLPAPRKADATRAYTMQEIALLLQYCGPRERALVLLLASTGMRIEAAAQLCIRHLQYNEQYGLYKVTVYHLDPHEYICFTTPEAAQAIREYLEYRQRCGEKITPETPLIREEFDADVHFIARHPKAMRAEALGDILRYRLQKAGIIERIPLQESQRRGQKRHPIPRSHGFRRFVITAMINHRINETIRNLLTDHSVKLDKDYVYPTEEEKLLEYLKVVDVLTINEENRLKRKVEKLTVRADKLDILAAQVANLTKMMGGRMVDTNITI
jgi:integrase